MNSLQRMLLRNSHEYLQMNYVFCNLQSLQSTPWILLFGFLRMKRTWLKSMLVMHQLLAVMLRSTSRKTKKSQLRITGQCVLFNWSSHIDTAAAVCYAHDCSPPLQSDWSTKDSARDQGNAAVNGFLKPCPGLQTKLAAASPVQIKTATGKKHCGLAVSASKRALVITCSILRLAPKTQCTAANFSGSDTRK